MLTNYKDFSISYISEDGFPRVIEHSMYLRIQEKSFFIIFENGPYKLDLCSSDLSRITIKAYKDLYSWLELKGEFIRETHSSIHKILREKLNSLGYPDNIEYEAYLLKKGIGIEHREDRYFAIKLLEDDK